MQVFNTLFIYMSEKLLSTNGAPALDATPVTTLSDPSFTVEPQKLTVDDTISLVVV